MGAHYCLMSAPTPPHTHTLYNNDIAVSVIPLELASNEGPAVDPVSQALYFTEVK